MQSVIWQIDPPAPASRVGRPRTRSVHQFPCVPASKVGRPRSKSVYQPKVKEVSKKNPTKQKSVKTTPPLEQNVVVVIDPEEQLEDLDFPYPVDQLPDLPLVEPDQVPNNNPQLNQPNPQPNLPNQPPYLPAELPNQPNQPQNPPTNPPNQPNQPNPPPNQPPNLPANPPDPMANPQQLNWSYFKPEFAGKPEEDVEAHLLRTNDWMENA